MLEVYEISSCSKIFLFRPPTRKRKAGVFKSLHFKNIRFAILGQTGGKIFVFNQKRICVDEI